MKPLQPDQEKPMRLAKYLAGAGIASRRRSERIIADGRVTVNGQLIYEPQFKVTAADQILVDGEIVAAMEDNHYILLHKPPGYISTAADTHNRPIVTELTKGFNVRLYPVGRLDADTSGVLLLTNDGELAYRLTHPRYGIKKVYHASVRGIPDQESLFQVRKGVVIDGYRTAPAKIKLLKVEKALNQSFLEIILIEGRKRQVKKICSAIEHPVKELRRIAFAGLKVDDLAVGSYRHLSEQEVSDLYNFVGLEK